MARIAWLPTHFQQIREDEALTLHDVSTTQRHGLCEHGPIVGERVELAPLATGVDSYGQLRQEAGVELAPGKGWRQLSRVHARQPRLEARPDHVAGQRVRGNAPEGEERCDARGRQVVLPVAADVFQEQVAERHGGDALTPGPV